MFDGSLLRFELDFFKFHQLLGFSGDILLSLITRCSNLSQIIPGFSPDFNAISFSAI